MSSQSESHASFSNNDHFIFTPNDEEILKDMDQKNMVSFHCMAIVCNSHVCFYSPEMGTR
jgi:trehalose-6-phosphate synthase